MEPEQRTRGQQKRPAQVDVAVRRREAIEMRAADRREHGLRPLARNAGQGLAVEHGPHLFNLLCSHSLAPSGSKSFIVVWQAPLWSSHT